MNHNGVSSTETRIKCDKTKKPYIIPELEQVYCNSSPKRHANINLRTSLETPKSPVFKQFYTKHFYVFLSPTD